MMIIHSRCGEGSLRRITAIVLVLAVVAAMAVVSAASPLAAATLTVTTSADVVADDGVCSLREAIAAANTDTASGTSPGECPAGAGNDVITFAVTSVTGGGFLINSTVEIDGGPAGVVISGGDPPCDCTMFTVNNGAHATFVAVTIADAGSNGVVNFGTTVVSNSTITNTGLAANGGTNSITAGILSGQGSVTVANSTVADNGGFAILQAAQGDYNWEFTYAEVGFATITGNDDGGIVNLGAGASMSLRASIVAGNGTSEFFGEADVYGDFSWSVSSGGFNVIGEGPDVETVFTNTGDVTGVTNPGLGPLADNGGPTPTHSLLDGSPARDRVTGPLSSDPGVDQRGVARPQGAATDSGAYEDDRPMLLPGGFGTAEGQSGSQIFEIPITLSHPSTETITVDYMSWPCTAWGGCGDGFATAGVDYEEPQPGTLTFQPGETTKTVPVTVYGDLDVEPAYLWGEWFLIRFLDPSPNAVLDTSFFGLGAGVIGHDD